MLCLCDLSLLENPNIPMCLLQKQGQTWARGSHAGLTAHHSPLLEVFSILTFMGLNQTDQRKVSAVFLGVGRSHFSPQLSACFTKSSGRERTGCQEASPAPRSSELDITIRIKNTTLRPHKIGTTLRRLKSQVLLI